MLRLEVKRKRQRRPEGVRGMVQILRRGYLLRPALLPGEAPRQDGVVS